MTEPRYRYEHHADDEEGQPHVFLCPKNRDLAVNQQVLDWCAEQFDEAGVPDPWSHNSIGNAIWIKDAEHAFTFRLRWC